MYQISVSFGHELHDYYCYYEDEMMDLVSMIKKSAMFTRGEIFHVVVFKLVGDKPSDQIERSIINEYY